VKGRFAFALFVFCVAPALWAQAGENQTFDDMDDMDNVPMDALK
jgi:5-keto 4-deoxyuronate isomerase